MNIQDRKKSFTAEELRIRYNLDGLDKDRKAIQLVRDTLNKVEVEFQKFMDIINGALTEYPNQAEITAWFFDGIPTDEQPVISDSSQHIGDFYYDRQTGKAYQYVYDNSEYVWEERTEPNIVESLSVENSRADTSDNKRLVFNTTPTTPYSIGDVWIKEGTYYRCRAARESGSYNNVDWIIYTEYTDDLVLLDTRAVLDQFEKTVTQNYVTTTQLETNTNGIYASVSATYSTKIALQATDAKAVAAQTLATTATTDIGIQAGKIEVINRQIGDRTGKTSTITADIDGIRASISDIADITTSESTTTAFISDTALKNINASNPINIEIKPINENISYIYPRSNLYPSSTLYLKTRTLRFENTSTNEIFDYVLPDDLLYYDADVYDSFYADYENRVCKVRKKCKYNADGTVGLLATPTEVSYNFSDIESNLNLTAGNYEVSLLGYTTGYIFVRLMSQNVYTTQFATKVELSSTIEAAADEINAEVIKKVGNNEVISKINLSPEAATIAASKINISGVITAMNNDTTTTIDGDKITTGTITADQLSSNSVNASKIVAGTITANKIADATITGSKIANGTITGTKIEDASISGGKLVDATIDNAKIANGTITGAKIANGTITATQISNSTITAAKIVDSTITGAKIANATITSAKIISVEAEKITTGIIRSTNYVQGSSGTAISLNDGSIDTKYFKVDSTGEITSTAGKIGGWTIGGNRLYSGSGSSYIRLDANPNVVTGIWCGSENSDNAPFKVTKAGKLTATNAVIRGSITATSGSFTGSLYTASGTIGGWTINSSGIIGTYGNVTTRITPRGIHVDDASAGVSYWKEWKQM